MSNNSRRRGFSPLLAFFLGFLFGIIVLIGAVVGAVVFALNYKLDNIAANKDEEGNYIYVNADAESGGAATVLELAKKVTEFTGDTSSLTLGQIEGLLPVANKLTDGVFTALNEYVEVEPEEIKTIRFSELGDYFQNKVMEVRIATLLEKFGGSLADNEFVNLILYDENNEPLTIKQLTEGDMLAPLKNKKVMDFIGAGNELTNKLIGDITVGDLLDGKVDFEKIVNELEISTFVDISPSDSLLAFLAFSITEISEAEGEYPYTAVYHPMQGENEICYVQTENGKIKNVFKIDGSETEKTTLLNVSSQVSRLTSTLKIKDIIKIDESNKLLSSVSDSTIDELPDYINNMSINELYADNIYEDSEGNATGGKMYRAVSAVSDAQEEAEYNPAYLYYVNVDGKYKLVNAGAANAGKVSEEDFIDGVYYTRGKANAMWKLLLYANGSEQAFSVNNLTSMIDNVTANTSNTTMRDLHEAGIMTFDRPEELDIRINYNGKETIGDLTLSELVGFFVYIAKNPAFGTILGSIS